MEAIAEKPSTAERLRHFLFFCKTSLDSMGNLEKVGTFLPGGPSLARALSAPLSQIAEPRRVLEVGPGSGSLTRVIVRQLGPRDTLTLVEILPSFAGYLEEWRKGLAPSLRDRIEVVCGDFCEFSADPFDVIISGAPFNALPAEVVGRFFDQFRALSMPHSIVSTYEYLGSGPLRSLFPSTREKTREARSIVRCHRQRAEVYQHWILGHLPPIAVSYYSGRMLCGRTPTPMPPPQPEAPELEARQQVA